MSNSKQIKISRTEKFLTLLNPKYQKNPNKWIHSLKITEILDLLSEQFANGNKDSVILLRAVFLGIEGREASWEDKNKIIRTIFVMSNQNEIETVVLSDLIGFLLLEIEDLPIIALVELKDFLISQIPEGKISNVKSLELIPKLLSVASGFDKVPSSEDGMMTGKEYASVTIHKICNLKWLPSSVVPMTTMMRDINLKDEELTSVIDKIINMMHEIGLEEVPSLVYQILLLSVKGCKQTVLDGILKFFSEATNNSEDGEDEEENQFHSFLQEEESDSIKKRKRAVEGTTLLHVIFAVRRDQELGREFVKYIKGHSQDFPAKLLSPFTVSLMLSLTQINRLEEPIFDFLKAFCLKVFKDDEHRKNSKWIRGMFPVSLPVERLLLNTITNSKSGWDHVPQGLIHFGFLLIDTYVPKQNDIFTITSEACTITQRACIIGAKIIQQIFKIQEIFREAILQQVLKSIITKTSVNQQHYLDLLASIVSTVPQIVLDCLPKFRDVFDYLPKLTVQTAEGLLRAVLPLMRVSMTIKDSLILVLRKSMFSMSLEPRKVAVVGFLLILKHFKIESENSYSLSSQVPCSQMFSCSQLEISTQNKYNMAANEVLCLELIGTLQKCLTQHSLVRQHFYKGLYEVICKNPKLSHATLDLLHSQFLKYFNEADDQIPPIKLELCIANRNNEIQQLEPLDCLVCVLQLCTKKSGRRLDQVEEEDEALSHLLDDIEQALDSLTKRMIKTDLEDFNLDKTAEFQATSEDGAKNTILANIVLGIYEVLIEYNFMKDKEIKVETCETTQNLFDKHQALIVVLQDASNNNGKKGKSGVSKISQRPSLLSFKCSTTMLTAVLSNDEVESQHPLNLLRQSSHLSKYLASSVVTKLQQLVTLRQCDGAGGKNLEHLFRQCFILSRTFLQYINGDCMIATDVLRKDKKGKKLGNICLEGLNHIVGFVCSHLPSKIKELLENLDFHPDVISQNDATSEGSLIYRVTRRIQRLIMKTITSPDDDLGLKEAQVLISMLPYLTPHLQHEDEIGLVYTWFLRLCVETAVDDVILMKTIMTKFLSLHHQCKGSFGTISKICQDIHSQVGDIDEDIEVENSSNFTIITESNATPAAFILIGQHIEKVLDEIDWSLNKLKNVKSVDEEHKEKQSKICQALMGIVLSLHELVQTAFTPGACADLVIKVLTKLYAILGSLTKYFLAQYTQLKSGRVQKFEKLVKLAGSHLSQQIYAMISYMQSAQAQEQTSNTTSTKQKSKMKMNRAGKSRAMKDSKSIPNLIYRIEEFERHLIQLSKKSKIDLTEGIKRSTVRDFRISAASLEAALQETENHGDHEPSIDESNLNSTNTHNDTTVQRNNTPSARNGTTTARNDTVSARNDTVSSRNVTASVRNVTASVRNVTASVRNVTASARNGTASAAIVTDFTVKSTSFACNATEATRKSTEAQTVVLDLTQDSGNDAEVKEPARKKKRLLARKNQMMM